MSGVLHVIGVDPGQTTGLCSLTWADGRLTGVDVAQVSPALVLPVVELLMSQAPGPVELAVERFVVGYRSTRSSTPQAGATTRDLVGALQQLHRPGHVRVTLRNAQLVKPWATDTRLDMAGITTHLKGMRHAADAARHALFCAVHDHRVRDPLSRTDIRHRSPR